GWVRGGGGEVFSIGAGSTRGGSTVFQGFSPFFAWAAYRLAAMPLRSASARLVAGARTTMTFQPCRLPPLGANRAWSRIFTSVSSGSGSSVNSRAANVLRITSKSSMTSPEDLPHEELAGVLAAHRLDLLLRDPVRHQPPDQPPQPVGRRWIRRLAEIGRDDEVL